MKPLCRWAPTGWPGNRSAGLSRAMNITPSACARLIAGTIALESFGVMRMVLAPPAIMCSIAVTWPALSPSALPAALSSLAPLAPAAAWAPSFIFTKKGLVSVLVISPITGWSAARAMPLASIAETAARAMARVRTAAGVVIGSSQR